MVTLRKKKNRFHAIASTGEKYYFSALKTCSATCRLFKLMCLFIPSPHDYVMIYVLFFRHLTSLRVGE
jgi:hypothetical protein